MIDAFGNGQFGVCGLCHALLIDSQGNDGSAVFLAEGNNSVDAFLTVLTSVASP